MLPTDVLLRDCRTSDVPRMHEIDHLCFERDIAYTRSEIFFCLRHPKSISKAAERTGEMVAFALGRTERGGFGHVITLDVIAEARRCGIGRALLGQLHDGFRRAGVPFAILEVDVRNTGARSFYVRMGYELLELLPGYYLGRSDAYRMALRL